MLRKRHKDYPQASHLLNIMTSKKVSSYYNWKIKWIAQWTSYQNLLRFSILFKGSDSKNSWLFSETCNCEKDPRGRMDCSFQDRHEAKNERSWKTLYINLKLTTNIGLIGYLNLTLHMLYSFSIMFIFKEAF